MYLPSSCTFLVRAEPYSKDLIPLFFSYALLSSSDVKSIDKYTFDINSLHPNISIHIFHTILYIYITYRVDLENSLNIQEFLL